MKTDLEILIAHVQSEYDYLKASLEECMSEWDFKGAEAFRKPLIFTEKRLNVLKSLENPNFNKIKGLLTTISKLEKYLTDPQNNVEFLDDKMGHEVNESRSKWTKIKIEENKAELDRLLSIPLVFRMDDDKILGLLEDLDRKQISQLEFEIRKGKLYLYLRVKDDHGEIEIKAVNSSMSSYIVEPMIPTLKQLGFSMETYTKQIPNFSKIDKLIVLTELSIIYFEVFGVFGKEVNIKVD
jgi:hypothetical protein